MAGRAGAVPAGGRVGVPVGEPGDHRAPVARPRGRDLARHLWPDARPAELDVRPRPRRPGPGPRPRAVAGGVLPAVPRLPARHHGARGRGRAHPGRRHQRLPVDHPRPLLRVAGAPPPRCPGPVARRPPRRDGRGHGADLQRPQRRRVPVRLREQPGRLRRRVRRAVGHHGLARGAARRPALPDGRPDHRGRRPAVPHAGPLRRGLPRALQVQPQQADRDAGAVGLRPRPVPDARLRRHDRLRPDQDALLRRAHGHQPDRRSCRRGRT